MNKIKFKTIILYGIFGLLTTLISWLSYSLLYKYCNLSENASNVLSWLIAVLFAYITNKMFVFKNEVCQIKPVLIEAFKFFSSRLFSGIIEAGGFAFLIHVGFTAGLFGIKGLFAKVIITIIVIIVNYIFTKKILKKEGRL